MKIAIGSDHGGYALKEHLRGYLEDQGHEVEDCGTYHNESCDYPIYGKAVATRVAEGHVERGIVVCTTGIGISMVANKVRGVRAALCHDEQTATLTRQHNDANVLALGAVSVDRAMAERIADIFLNEPFSGEEKHKRRIAQMMAIEEL